ncbi:MAG: cytidine deaminase [Elusimicrobiota bacterium]|jgi:cytidine deaminase
MSKSRKSSAAARGRRKALSAAHRRLIKAAKSARKQSYSPYSRYPVGAAVLTESGRIFSGTNVENACYNLGICAERTAIGSAVTRGEKALKAVCVVGHNAQPCGACRQVMMEFSTKETELLLVNTDPKARDSTVLTRVAAMLPAAFDPLDSGLLPRRKNER